MKTFQEIIRNHDQRMGRIRDCERRQHWGDLYTEATKLIDELVKVECEALKLRNKIDYINEDLY